MSRTTKAAQMLLDGRRIKWTLEQREQVDQRRVGIDWLRFTLPLDAVVRSERSNLPQDLTYVSCLDKRGRELVMDARNSDADLDYSSAHHVAAAGARIVCETLGRFAVGVVEDRGMDYYTARAAITFAGETVGYVLAGGKSSQQAGTVHVNLFGSAMVNVSADSLARIKALIDQSNGWITRVDMCLDLWQGYGVQDVRTAYLAGEFDVRGKRPKQEEHGSWTSGHSRTFQVGSRETGKVFRGYEKGDQLFGHEAKDPWVRFEVEVRNNQRVITTDVLTRPADFFAGAYPFCARVLEEIDQQAARELIPTRQKVADKTAEAAVTKLSRWVRDAAMPAVIAVFEHGGDLLGELISQEKHRVARRLRGFDIGQVSSAFEKVAAAFAPAVSPLTIGAH